MTGPEHGTLPKHLQTPSKEVLGTLGTSDGLQPASQRVPTTPDSIRHQRSDSCLLHLTSRAAQSAPQESSSSRQEPLRTTRATRAAALNAWQRVH